MRCQPRKRYIDTCLYSNMSNLSWVYVQDSSVDGLVLHPISCKQECKPIFRMSPPHIHMNMIYLYTCMIICIHMFFQCILMQPYIHIYIYINVCIYIYIYINMYRHRNIYICTYRNIYVFMCVCMCIHL